MGIVFGISDFSNTWTPVEGHVEVDPIELVNRYEKTINSVLKNLQFAHKNNVYEEIANFLIHRSFLYVNSTQYLRRS